MLAAAACILWSRIARLVGKVPGAVLALLIALIASNLCIIPRMLQYLMLYGVYCTARYSVVIVPIRSSCTFLESGRMLFGFSLLSSLGTVIGTLISLRTIEDIFTG